MTLMKSSKRHVAFISLTFLLKCLSKSIFIRKLTLLNNWIMSSAITSQTQTRTSSFLSFAHRKLVKRYGNRALTRHKSND